MIPSLGYLEEELLYPTRSARFESARRMRLTHQCALWGQGISAIAMIAWSVAPLFYPRVAQGGHLSFFNIIASVYILALAMHQQAANYVDRARSLEASARRIDSLRRLVQASILEGNDGSAVEFKKLSSKYSEILEENPINHDLLDHRLAESKHGSFRFYRLKVIFYLRAASALIFCIGFVVLLPILFLTAFFKPT